MIDEVKILKVAGVTNPGDLAGAITHQFVDGENIVVLQAVGNKAVYAAIKAVIDARSMCISQGHDLMIFPSYFHDQVEDGEVVGIRLTLRKLSDRMNITMF